MDETDNVTTDTISSEQLKLPEDEAIYLSPHPTGPSEPLTEATQDIETQLLNGAVRTLDGEIAGDEFAGDAVNYQILLGKIEGLLERLKLDA